MTYPEPHAEFPAAVLWDMDGTLVDTEPHWIAAERDLVATYGNEWPDEHALALIGSDLLTAGAYIAEHGPVPLTPEAIVDALLDGVVGRIASGVDWRPGARELLAGLRAQGVATGLVTMSWMQFAGPVLALLPPDSFDVVVTGEVVRHGKPHPEPYLHAARALGVDPAHCIAIEDSITGAISAVAAGCHVLGVPMSSSMPMPAEVTVLPDLSDVDVAWLAQWWSSRVS